MDRAEATGLGVAAAGHIALLAALSLGFAAAKLPPIKTQPIEVSFVDEVGLESTAPEPDAAEPAPKLGEVEGPPEPMVAPPMPEPVPVPPPQAQPQPQPPPRAAPRPVPQPQPRRPAPQQPKAAPLKPAAKPAPPKPAAKPAPAPAQKGSATRPTGRLKGLLNGLSDSDSPSRSTGKPAAKAGSAVEASLVAEVRRQLKPQWQRVVPTGADAENLRTEVRLTLARDGRVSRIDVVGTTGVTASNRPQVALHQERAKKAVMLASPFRLPAEFYDAWKDLNVTLDLRLSQ